MPASLQNQFISDVYTSLLHLSGLQLTSVPDVVCDGLGNNTSLSLSLTSVGIKNIVFPDSQTPPTPVNFIDYIYPVGSVFISVLNSNPGIRFPGTTWQLTSQGRFLIGVGTGTDSNGVRKTFAAGINAGEYQHALSIQEMPAHTHDYLRINLNDTGESDNNQQAGDTFTSAKTSSTGGDSKGNTVPHNSTPPSEGFYVWFRTA